MAPGSIDFPALFRSLASPSIMFAVDDPEFTILEQNDAHAKLTMVKRGDVIGRPLLEVFPDISDAYKQTGRSELVESIRRVLTSGKKEVLPQLHYDIRDRSGSFVEKYWKLVHHPVCNNTHQVVAIYQLAEDVTQQRLDRAALEASETRLQHYVELNRSKDEFISIASHQLRTPATGVKQYIGMLLEGFAGDVTPLQMTMLEKAYESNERQLRIVSDLLKVAQVDAGKVTFSKSYVDLNALVRDIISEQKKTVASRHQHITFTSANPNIIVFIDQDSIRMVIENVIDNATKYSYEGKYINVGVSLREQGACITVTDEGVGISKKDQGRLFEKFSRIDNPLSTKVGGTGLGLYWAKKIVDLHDGDIMVDSKGGKGTTFTICLPRKQ